jgi:hypothetical protein
MLLVAQCQISRCGGQRGHDEAAWTVADTMVRALGATFAEHAARGRHVRSIEELEALRSGANEPADTPPIDPWGTAYELVPPYAPSDLPARIMSAGPDGEFCTDDDLVCVLGVW